MDETHFDTIARSLTADRSRRGLARFLGGLALGGPLALLRLTEAEARRKKKKKRKKKPKIICLQRCGDRCIAADDCCVNGTWVPNWGRYRHCGRCQQGQLYVDPAKVYCTDFDDDGCHACDASDYYCNPGNDGRVCFEGCGACKGGLCQDDDQADGVCGSYCCVRGSHPDCCRHSSGESICCPRGTCNISGSHPYCEGEE